MRNACLALAVLLILRCAAAACTVENARYVQVGTPGATASFGFAGGESTAASDLVFLVQPASHAYRFRFQQSNGYGGISLEPARHSSEADDRRVDRSEATSDLPAIRFIPYRADLTEIADAPRSGAVPPSLIVLPDLGEALWYDAYALGGPAEREVMSRSAFVLSGCDRDSEKGQSKQ
jgi:hypothetical protein